VPSPRLVEGENVTFALELNTDAIVEVCYK
jgi:hypothetical protein